MKMQKLLTLMGMLFMALSVSAADVFVDSLTGYSGSSVDAAFRDALAANGLQVGSTDANKSIVFNATGAAFGTVASGDDGRNHMMTVATDYNVADIDVWVTAKIPSVGGKKNIYFGMGVGNVGYYGLPDWGNGNHGVYMVMHDTNLFNCFNAGNFPAYYEHGLNLTGAYELRLKMSYKANAKTVTFSVDKDMDGEFDFTHGPVNISALFTAGQACRIYFGGDNGVVFTDLQVGDGNAATNPVPAIGATFVDTSTGLSWEAPIALTPDSYTLYHSTDPNLDAIGTTSVSGLTLASLPYSIALEPGTTYYWRVDSIAGTETYKGSNWNFTTTPAVPVFTAQPKDTTVASGQTATFTVSAINVTEWSWYKQGSTDVLGTAATLTLADVDVTDEGFYYCVISSGNPADDAISESARLMTQRLVAHWSFDDTLDSEVSPSGQVFSGQFTYENANLSELFVDGIAGKAFTFVNDPNHIVIQNSADEFNFYPLGLTVAAWVKPAASPGYSTIVSKSVQDIKQGWGLSYHSGQANFALRGFTGENWSGGLNNNPPAWHLFVAQVDMQAGKTRLFVNGQLKSEISNLNTPVVESPASLIIGAEKPDGSTPFVGAVDEVMIWNYAIDMLEVGAIYADMTSNAVCVAPVANDLNGDCIINLEDFALLAGSWLESNMVYPASN